MTTQIISLDKLPQVLTDFAERFPEDALRAIRQTARESRVILAKMTSDTKPFSPIDTGAYMRAWQGIPHEEGADIINDVAQASTLEWGRQPGTYSPIDELTEWVLRKSRGPWNKVFREPDPLGFKAQIRDIRRQYRGARGIKRQEGENVARRVAQRYAAIISEKHYLEGFKPRLVFTRSLPGIFKLLERNLDEALQRAARRNWGLG